MQHQATRFAERLTYAIDATLAEEPILITAEGVAIQAPKTAQELAALESSIQKTGGSIIKDGKKLVENESKVKNGIEHTRHGYKHASHRKIPFEKIVQSTQNGPAKYMPGINIQQLELYVWENGKLVNNGKNWKVFKCNEIIGAMSGKETTCVLIKCKKNTINGHPILNCEYLELLK